MTLNQLRAIECLTSQMLIAAPYSARPALVFTVKAERDGYIVEGATVPEHMQWFDKPYLVLAFVGPRGGVKHRKEYY